MGMSKRYILSIVFFLLAVAANSSWADYSRSLDWQNSFDHVAWHLSPPIQGLTFASLSGRDKYVKIAKLLPEQSPPKSTSKIKLKLAVSNTTPENPTQELVSLNELSLSMDEFIRLVREKNEKIIAQNLEFKISREAIKSAWAKFEPEAIASYEHQVSEQNYTKEDQRRLLTTKDSRNDRSNNYNAAIQAMAPTGGTVTLSYALSGTTNQFNENTGEEFQTDVVAEVKQPLLKNAGIETTMADVNLAKADSSISFQDYRLQMMQVVHDAEAAYWKVVMAQEQYKISLDSVKIAQKVLHDSQERLKLGKMAETDVFEAQAGLATRKALSLAARNELNTARNELSNFISLSVIESGQEIVATTKLMSEKRKIDLQDSILKALSYRPDYLAALKKLVREDIRVAFTKNQRWPQLDLTGSYGLNGLQNSVGDSFDDAMAADDIFWKVGLEFNIPLGGGEKSRSELAAARHRKRQALLEAKALENTLKNMVHSRITGIKSAAQQKDNYQLVADMKKKLLEVELAWLEQGKSDSQKVLKREDEYHQAQNDYLRSIVENNNAILELDFAEGTLLQRLNIDVKEEKL